MLSQLAKLQGASPSFSLMQTRISPCMLCRQLDAASGSRQPVVSGHPAPICTIAVPVSGDDSTDDVAATTCVDGVLRVWRAHAGTGEPQVRTMPPFLGL